MTSASPRPVIVWFRDDLRLSDHPALAAAARTGRPLLCVFVLDEVSAGIRPHGGASRWWLAQSLRSLQRSLSAAGADLVLRRGAAAAIITELAQHSGAEAVYFNDIAMTAHRAVAAELTARCAAIGIAVHQHLGDLLAAPEAIRNKDGRGLKVFTPFWKRLLALGAPPQPLAAPDRLTAAPAQGSDHLEAWQLEPSTPDWAGGLRASWQPGEAGAHQALQTFLDNAVAGYATERDRPDRDATSRLSPHLRFGEISPRQIWHAARFAAAAQPAISADVDKFLSELGWRDFCRHLLFDHPELMTRNLQPAFDRFPWRSDAAALRAWQRGLTGYPIVDAGMRELWQTGTMHNRVRMVVASFLVKHLLIDWRDGEQWFWDTLVDADPGSNPGNWQWVAGCGADAAPYFRVFNPIMQGEKFDPNGDYVRRFVPELARLPAAIIHQPWTATPLELASAGVTIGKNYPAPIVDHRLGRERALAAYATVRKN